MKKNSQEITIIDVSLIEEIGKESKKCAICGENAYNVCSLCKTDICKCCTIEHSNERTCYICKSSQSRVEILDDLERNKTICIDFDGVISSYDGRYNGVGEYGEPIPGIDLATKWLKDHGWFIIINTCRDENEQMEEFCKKNNICFDEINKNPDQPEGCSDKPLADVYLDDKAINFNGDWGLAIDRIEKFKPWWEEKEEKQDIRIFSQKTFRDRCLEACNVCGKEIEGKALRYDENCYHKECLLGKRASVLLKAASDLNTLESKMINFTLDLDDRIMIKKEIESIRREMNNKSETFHPLFKTGAEDNFNPSANNDSQIEDEYDGAEEADPVEKGKKSTTKNYIIRDDTTLHQDSPGWPTYPREERLVHRPQSIKE